MTTIEKILFLLISLSIALPVFGQGNVTLNAANLVLEETSDGIVITLEGPVEVTSDGNILRAESARVLGGDNLTSLEEAIESIELTGDVVFTGALGETGFAGSATYFVSQRRIVLQGGARLARGETVVSSDLVDYSLQAQTVVLTGHCSVSDGVISATADNVDYNLDARAGNLSGQVTVTYIYGQTLIGDEIVDEVILRADALVVSVEDGEVKTPAGPVASRTTVDAGDFSIVADSLAFTVSDDGVSGIEAEGDINLSGPDMQYLNAQRVLLNTAEGVILAEGGVSFSIRGQEGTAESIEVNFNDRWSIKLVGASIGGEFDENLLEGE